jgi:hypothetical protein
MRTTIAPAPITPVILMSGNAESGYSPAGGTGASQSSQQYTNITSAVVTADGDAGTIPAGGKGFIQNLDDAAVYVKLGTGAASSSGNFAFVLSAGSAANDGLGGSKEIADYSGIVSILAAAGSPRVVFTIFS